MYVHLTRNVTSRGESPESSVVSRLHSTLENQMGHCMQSPDADAHITQTASEDSLYQTGWNTVLHVPGDHPRH